MTSNKREFNAADGAQHSPAIEQNSNKLSLTKASHFVSSSLWKTLVASIRAFDPETNRSRVQGGDREFNTTD